ncbi:hypothetical protein LHL23_14075 [Leisingera sp. McT4-56]|nr:hypothetical protein [Leisingera sp. McT4-56]
MGVDWADLELQVREIAETHWDGKCEPRYVAGVKCDGIIELRDDYWVAIEVSRENSLHKLRTDLAKFGSIRPAQMAAGVYVECYFITLGDTTSLKDTGRANKVEVMSVTDFSEKFVGRSAYNYVRSQSNFGSAVDPDTGEKDDAFFSEVTYFSEEGNKKFSLEEIAERVAAGETLVLLGEFGSGKSRCVQEVFSLLTCNGNLFPVLAINLRECWGLNSFDLIIRSHLESLGLSKYADNLVKLAAAGKVKFLLDGFDEIGSQSWTGEVQRLKELRRRSLVGVYDLVSKCSRGGVLITGREHYFSDDGELRKCIGVSDSADFLTCPQEFSESELEEYLKSNTKLVSLPNWMPRKPLICQLFAKLEADEISAITDNANDEADFFERFLEAICARERKIHPSIDDEVLKKVLLSLAERTREKPYSSEEVSPDEINDSFFQVSGLTPLDESSIMLQRLPYLGRTDAGNSNRVFVDEYAKSGLKGLALRDHIYYTNKEISHKKWLKGVGDFGSRLLSQNVTNWGDAHKFAKFCQNHGNFQVAADVVAAQLESDEDHIDFNSLNVTSASFDSLNFSQKAISNLFISETTVGDISLEGAEFEKCRFERILAERVSGIGSIERLPEAFIECSVDHVDNLENVARISELPLTKGQKTIISVIKKLFFQKGRGRKEEALLRGLEEYWDKDSAEAFLRYALAEGIIIEARGRHGKLYVPQRRHTKRMANIIEKMDQCADEIWSLAK